ncbi:MAG TPA: hypothetical protein VG722_07285, partial [Tepidisphaeraceae bacterium]|nr:hypothetical protein [Tepidisphaeraceae bacterium]
CLRTGRWSAAFAAGMAAGCAAMFKPTGLSVIGAFGLVMFFQPNRIIRNLTAVLAGLIVPLAATLAYLLAANLLTDMPGLYRQISGYAADSALGIADLIKIPVVLFLLGIPIFMRGWLFRRRRIDNTSDPAASSLRFFIIAWFVIEIIGVVMQRRMYGYHFLVLAAPASLIFGMIPRRTIAVSMAAAVVPMALFSICCAAELLPQIYSGQTTLPISDYLSAHTSPGDRVWDEDAARILLETNLRPGSRCILTFLFANSDNSPLIFSQEILSDFHHTQPRYIVLKTDLDQWVHFEANNIWDIDQRPVRRKNYVTAWRNIDGYVKQSYVPVARIGTETVWQRRANNPSIASIK